MLGYRLWSERISVLKLEGPHSLPAISKSTLGTRFDARGGGWVSRLLLGDLLDLGFYFTSESPQHFHEGGSCDWLLKCEQT